MILTSNYGLKKPEGADLVNVEDFNANADVIDEKLGAVEAEMAAVKKSVSDGKTLVADAITAQGTATAADASFETMAENVTAAGTARYNAGVAGAKVGNATTADVLTGKTFTNAAGIGLSGTMKNLSASAAVTYTTSNKTPVVAGDAIFFEKNSDGVQRCCIRTGANNAGYTDSNTLFSYPMAYRGNWTGATTGSGNVTIPAGYHSGGGYVSGAGAYNAGVTAADNRANANSVNYKTGYNNGYNAGVAAADARANTSSANYKAGYDAGYSKGLDDGYWNGYHAGYNDGKYA